MLVRQMWNALGGSESILERLEITSHGDLESVYQVSDLATSAVAVAALAIAELIGNNDPKTPRVTVDNRLASLWFASSIHPIGWRMSPVWDPFAGDYRTVDGWIRLHTNAPRHRDAVEHVLGCHADRNSMSGAVGKWLATELETAVVGAGGCAAEMRSLDAWALHPQGIAVLSEPLVATVERQVTDMGRWRPSRSSPLAQLKVLDLTRILAGPVASRFLSGFGANVLRIDPPEWDEPGVVPEVTLGKRCARLDLHVTSDRRIFEDLLSQADVLLHGYRPGALDRLGYDEAARQSISPQLVDVSLNAYGWSGPWAARRGFDSLIQMSTGIAHAGMVWMNCREPKPLPVQALDHATGYLMAAQVIRSLSDRLTAKTTTTSRLSLARCAKLLSDQGERGSTPILDARNALDLSPRVERTFWGEVRRLRPPVEVEGASMDWRYPASPLGSADPTWG